MHKKIINEQKLTKISHNPKNNVISKIAPKTCTRNTPFIAKNTFDTDGDAPKAKALMAKITSKIGFKKC